MAHVMTEVEIRKFQGMSQTVLPVGTVLTPAAKDWAYDHHLKIFFGEGDPAEPIQQIHCASNESDKEKAAVLHQVVESVIRNMKQSGKVYSQETLAAIIIKCLERLGCQVK